MVDLINLNQWGWKKCPGIRTVALTFSEEIPGTAAAVHARKSGEMDQFSSAIFRTTSIAWSAVLDVPCSVSTYPVQFRRRSSLKMNG
jgi:hypothetical protein